MGAHPRLTRPVPLRLPSSRLYTSPGPRFSPECQVTISTPGIPCDLHTVSPQLSWTVAFHSKPKLRPWSRLDLDTNDQVLHV